MSEQKSVITNIGDSDDVRHILSVAEQLGAQIVKTTNGVEITGTLMPRSNELNCGESGLGVRLTTCLASTFGRQFTITGEGSLMERPMDLFERLLPPLGVEIQTNEGKLPVQISGKLVGGNLETDGSLSSQFFSGLLMALPLCEEDSWLKINNLASAPYIDITLDVLSMFGIIIPSEENVFFIKGKQHYQPAEFNIEGDWSGAAFWIVYGAITNGILVKEINMFSSQADAAILEVMDLANCQYEWLDEGLKVDPSSPDPFEIDLTQCPDLFPALVVMAASIEGISKIHGVNRLKHKESDRGIVLQKEFGKLGLKIDLKDDTMVIHGTGKLNSGTIDSNNDHRIAMAGAIAAVLTPEGIEVQFSEAVNKSYPRFWDLIK